MSVDNFKSIFGDVFSNREKNALNDAQEVKHDLKKDIEQSSKLMESYNERNQKNANSAQTSIENFQNLNRKLDNNWKSYFDSVDQRDLFHKDFAKTPLDQFVDVPEDLQIPMDLQEIQLNDLREVLCDLALKLRQARLTEEVIESRQQLDVKVQQALNSIKSEFKGKSNAIQYQQVPQQRIIELQKIMQELGLYDHLIPQIITELMARASQHVQVFIQNYKEFRTKMKAHLNQVKDYHLDRDKSLKHEFMNLGMTEREQIRVVRYSITIRNEDLLTIHEGRYLTPKIVNFAVNYFQEKLKFAENQDIHNVYLFKPSFFQNLIPLGSQLSPEYMTYKNVTNFNPEMKGRGNTVFDKFTRILIMVPLTDNAFVLVEIRSSPEKEILIYDPDYKYFSLYHERLAHIFRLFIFEELRQKTDMAEQECIAESRQYLGRSINVPQLHFPQDHGIYFINNLKFACQGDALHANSYRFEHVAQFRLELYTTLVRIGINQDRQLPFDILL